MTKAISAWIREGSPWIWLTAGTVSVCLVMVCGLLLMIALNGLAHFWPGKVVQFEYRHLDGSSVPVLGQVVDSEIIDTERLIDQGYPLSGESPQTERQLIKTGNRDIYGIDFQWVIVPLMSDLTQAVDVVVAEREEWGSFYGYIVDIKENGLEVARGDAVWSELSARLARRHQLKSEIRDIEKNAIGAINYRMEKIRLAERRLELEGKRNPATMASIATDRATLQADYDELTQELQRLFVELRRDSVVFREVGGERVEINFDQLVRVYRPNRMGVFDKFAFYFEKLKEFIFDEPREANTEGGVFPAIFGTVLMVLLMSIFVTPFGVVAAVYLREYAKQGPLTRVIRIAVNNLAGVPSVVYGVFGLGFFVYFVGGQVDKWFYPAALPAPTFGTPGLLWSSLTLAILTVPVVIVATEEGLSRIPRAIREGSLALGATKAETLFRTVLPMATPAMMTGMILAVARAAGEVAPLMMVGVVKLAPSLAVDGNFPYLHMERKFMHLGFHIYDVGFQSPNVEAARPLVYATALLLVVVIVGLNLAAIRIRNRLRRIHGASEG
jgi:phosphate transport system permease protein